MSLSPPTDDDKEELLLSCRYGDTEDIRLFIGRFGPDLLNDVRDDGGSCVLHMACGNGHLETVDFLLTVVSSALLSARNDAQSTPLHWAALNSHLPVVQRLVQFPKGPGKDLIDIKNSAGRTPLGEAENVGWDEGAKWMVEVMNLEGGDKDGDKPLDDSVEDVEVEIQDAAGQVARMKVSPKGSSGNIPASPSTK